MEQKPRIIDLLDLSDEEYELLNAAGFSRPAELAKVRVQQLGHEMHQAKSFLGLGGVIPSERKLAEWVSICERDLEKNPLAKSAPGQKIPSEGVEELVPEPIYLDKNRLRLSKVGPAKFERAVEIDIADKNKLSVGVRPRTSKSQAESGPKIRAERVSSLEDYARGKIKVKPLSRGQSSTRTRVKDETNQGVKNQRSRFFIHGVLHPRALRVWWGAFLTLAFVVLFPLALGATILLFTLSEPYHYFRPLLAIVPALLLIVGIFKLSYAYNVRCCVCSQRIMAPKTCNRNKLAHRIPGLGYIIPLALHLLIFRWCRCMFCGTAIRIKE